MPGDDPHSIRGEYERQGSDAFYKESGSTYRNPHEPQIIAVLDEALRQWPLRLDHVLDLAAGSGEITIALRQRGAKRISGVDPYTFEAFQSRTGLVAERFTFDEIADGALSRREFSLITCSFAMHLCQPSRLPRLALQLSLIAPQLLILTPHKRPIIKPEWGWDLQGEMLIQRIRARLYNSTHLNPRPNGSTGNQSD